MENRLLVEQLGHGEEEATPARELAARLGVDDRRLRRAVMSARLDGVPILSSREGYFLPSLDRRRALLEKLQFENTMRARIKATCRAITATGGSADVRE